MEKPQLVGAKVLRTRYEICTKSVVLSVNADGAKLKIFSQKKSLG